MKQSILFRLCRQRQEMCFMDLICFPYIPAMDYSSCYKACLMVCFTHIFYLHGNDFTTKIFCLVVFCCCFVSFFVFFLKEQVLRRKMRDRVIGRQHVTVAKAMDRVVIYEVLRIKSK